MLTAKRELSECPEAPKAKSAPAEPHAHGPAVHGLVQLREAAQEPEGAFASDGSGIECHTLERDRHGRNDRHDVAEAGTARPLQSEKFKLRHYLAPKGLDEVGEIRSIQRRHPCVFQMYVDQY
jgi:hypothetical protein